MRNTSSASRGGSGELAKLVPSVRRGKRRARIGIGALLTALLMATQMAAPALAEGNPPSVECGEGVLYNKFQWNDGFSEDESNFPDDEFVIDVSVNEGGETFHYELTDDDYVITKIILKIGEGGGATPPDPIEDPESEGDLPIPDKLSHVTFCLDDAPEPPTPPTVTASIVCTADPETGVATYTLDVDAPQGVTTDPADGTVVDNEDTEVTVLWEGDPFTVTAEETEDCSFTPREEPPTPPTVSASIICTANQETGEASYTLDVEAPAGVTTDPVDGAVVDNVDTPVTVTWSEGTFEVTAEATEDCSFTPAGSEVLPRRLTREKDSTVEGEVLAQTGSSDIEGFAWAGIAFLLVGLMMIAAAGRNGSPVRASGSSGVALLVFDQAYREILPVRSSRRGLGLASWHRRRLPRRRT